MSRFDMLVRKEQAREYRLDHKPAFVSRVLGELIAQDLHSERLRMSQTRFDIIQTYASYCLIYLILASVALFISPYVSDLLTYMQFVDLMSYDIQFAVPPYILAMTLAGSIWVTHFKT